MILDAEEAVQSDKLIIPKIKPQRSHWHMNSVRVITKTFEKNLELLYANRILSKVSSNICFFNAS